METGREALRVFHMLLVLREKGDVAGAFACERKRNRAEALDEGEQGPGQEASALVPRLSHAH
jgi:hypothetical protein